MHHLAPRGIASCRSRFGLRLRDRNGQRNGAAVACYHVHRFERKWRYSHGLAFYFHYQEMIFLSPSEDIRVFHLLPHVSGPKLASGTADDEMNAAGALI